MDQSSILKFSGAIISDTQDADCIFQASTWICQLCSATNSQDIGQEQEPEQEQKYCCRCCKRSRQPTWLKLKSGDIIRPGLKVLLRDEIRAAIAGIVIEINYFKKNITLMSIQNVSKRNTCFEFKEIEIPAATFHQMELLLEENPFFVPLNTHGICGNCRSVFRIHNAQAIGKEEELLPIAKEIVATTSYFIQEKENQKKQFITQKKYADVLKCTEEIKAKRQELLKDRRRLEMPSTAMQCPYCTWTKDRVPTRER